MSGSPLQTVAEALPHSFATLSNTIQIHIHANKITKPPNKYLNNIIYILSLLSSEYLH